MLLLTLVFLWASLCNAAASPNPHGITLAPRAANATLPTITLAPLPDQTMPSNLSVTVTGAQVELITNVPELNGDALLAFGPDAANNFQSIYEENCLDGLDSPNCLPSLQSAVSVDQQSLEKRIIPALIAGGVMAVAVAIEAVRLDRQIDQVKPISRQRVASADVSKLSAVVGSPTIVFVTTTSGGTPITAVPNRPQGIQGSIQIVTATVDSATFHKGDYIASLPEQPGFELVQYVNTYADCAFVSRSGCNNENLAGYASSQAILQVKPGGLLSAFTNLPSEISQWTIFSPLSLQLPAVINSGKQVKTLNPTQLNTTATWLLLATYNEIIEPKPQNPTQIVIPASDIVTTTSPAAQSSAAGSECPIYPPNCSNCGNSSIPLTTNSDGYTNTNGICKGLPYLKKQLPRRLPLREPQRRAAERAVREHGGHQRGAGLHVVVGRDLEYVREEQRRQFCQSTGVQAEVPLGWVPARCRQGEEV